MTAERVNAVIISRELWQSYMCARRKCNDQSVHANVRLPLLFASQPLLRSNLAPVLGGWNGPPPSVPRRSQIGRHRVYPLCQASPPSSRTEGGQADPLTLCAPKAAIARGRL